jgi:hypothetical protein
MTNDPTCRTGKFGLRSLSDTGAKMRPNLGRSVEILGSGHARVLTAQKFKAACAGIWKDVQVCGNPKGTALLVPKRPQRGGAGTLPCSPAFNQDLSEQRISSVLSRLIWLCAVMNGDIYLQPIRKPVEIMSRNV